MASITLFTDTMKLSLFLTLVGLLASPALRANNIQVSPPTLENNTGTTVMLQFDVSWENSWRGGPVANWDAAWIFAKVRMSSGLWQHVQLEATGHGAPMGTQIDVGLVDPGSAYNSSSNPAEGVFLMRDAVSYGTHGSGCSTAVELRGLRIAALNDVAEVRVYAIEMVYVNQGAFQMGLTGLGAVYTYPTNGSVFNVASEAAINVGTTAGNLYYAEGAGQSGDRGGPVPAAFPKGTNAFYTMKYEVSQQGYVDFLNTLTYDQQSGRTASAPNSAAGTGALIASNADRNGIDISIPGVAPGIPPPFTPAT
ncbi:MAG: hypothetical protein IPG69_18795 [Flavobacteriales bacterium]|nr:hypothetical protein [Flavobacteriales bacterium]